MNKELAQWFLQEVSQHMSFLVEEYSYAPPVLETDDVIHFATVSYRGTNLSLEFVLDQRDEHFELDISRLQRGACRDDDWNGPDDECALVRSSLYALVQQRAPDVDLFHKPGNLPFRDRISIWLSDYEQMLKKYAEDVLNDSPNAFDN